MAFIAELTRIDEWVFNRLNTDPTISNLVSGRIHKDLAPNKEKSNFPLIVFQTQASRDVRLVNGERLHVVALYIIRAIGEGGSFAGVEAVADQIDVLFNRVNGTVGSELEVLQCLREEPFQLIDVDAGIQFRHLGGMYRIWARAL